MIRLLSIWYCATTSSRTAKLQIHCSTDRRQAATTRPVSAIANYTHRGCDWRQILSCYHCGLIQKRYLSHLRKSIPLFEL